MKKKIGFIGVGDIATLHAAAIKKSPFGELYCVYNYKEFDISAGGHDICLQTRAKSFGCELVYTDLDEMLQDSKLEVVYVLTPLETHFEYVKQVLLYGKHCFVEKPVSDSISELLEIERLCISKNLLCFPGHNYIYEPQIIRIKDMIDSGSIGKLVSVLIMYNIYHPPSVTSKLPGIVKQIMTHHAYIARYLCGKDSNPKVISSMGGDFTNENDFCMVMMKMGDKSIIHMQASFANDDHTSDPWSFYIKVLGTKGGARYSYNDFIENDQHTIHSHTYHSFPYTIENINNQFLYDCLQTGEKPLSDINDAIWCVKILDAIEKSKSSGMHVNLSEET